MMQSASAQAELKTVSDEKQSVQEQLDACKSLIEELRAENDEIRAETKQLIEQVKKEEVESKFKIDRRIITSFLIQFLQKKNDATVQLSMVQSMSKVLEFSEDERKTLGLDEGSKGLLSKPEKP